MLIDLFYHLLSCLDKSLANECQCFIHVFRYILDSDDLQALASTFILDDVKIEAHMRMKILVQKEESREDD